MNATGLEKPTALVLLSSGLDSTFNLYKALQKFTVKVALTFDYGQRASAREILAATKLAKRVTKQRPKQPCRDPYRIG